MCYTNLAKIFKILFKNSGLEDKEKIFEALLMNQPFHDIDGSIRVLIGKAMAFAIHCGE